MNIEKQKPKKKHEIVRTFIYFASENHDAINFLSILHIVRNEREWTWIVLKYLNFRNYIPS